METNNEQKNIVQNNSLTEEVKSIEVCLADLKALGLDDEEIKKLDGIIDVVIDNRLDFLLSKLYNS
jgi:thioester reductase-like protein